ncbi:MAG: 3-phenylpropionate/trans-cinnamate dioxygenase ferredoxin component, partial [Frankiales bacterium]|nr:3-phenylpropionate/trans-cinnamate dioxygenase ferredoxin component [Frankiales bacterium]
MTAWVDVCGVDDLSDGTAKAYDIAGKPIALVRSDGVFYAIEDICSHADIALSEGEVDGKCIECWLHGSRFDLETGKPTGPPANRPVPVYPTKTEGGRVLVAVEVALAANTE